MQIKEFGELNIIKRFLTQFKSTEHDVIKGIGDDCAVVRIDEQKCLLITTDMLVEDIHFLLACTSPYTLAKKAVSASLSDISAMGGTPKYLLTSIALPAHTETAFVSLFYKGIKEKTEEFNMPLIGGNTSSSPDKIVIESIIIGEATTEQVVYRSGARVGDVIYTTGFLGDSALGLNIWKIKGDTPVTDPFMRDAMLCHINPAARVKEGRLIAERKLASAMIDISDGLLQDLRHITEESGVGARVVLSNIPLSTAMKRHILSKPEDIAFALSGGEDYELLFTAGCEKKGEIEDLSKETALPITQIGEIVPKEDGVKVINQDGSEAKIIKEGFEHFST